MEKLFELLNTLGELSEKQTSELKKAVDGFTQEEVKMMVKSYMGLFMDSICKAFEFNENETWKQLFEAHANVNESEGDF